MIKVKVKAAGTTFNKIGRTINLVKNRFSNNPLQTVSRTKTYRTWEGSQISVKKLERLVLKKFKTSIQTQFKFPGSTECFCLDLSIKEIIDFVDETIDCQAKKSLLEDSKTTGEVKSF